MEKLFKLLQNQRKAKHGNQRIRGDCMKHGDRGEYSRKISHWPTGTRRKGKHATAKKEKEKCKNIVIGKRNQQHITKNLKTPII